MRSALLWRLSAVILLVGGVLGAAGVVLAGFAAPWTGAWIVVVATVLEGLGILFAGIAMGRRLPACVLLMVAGGLAVLQGIAGAAVDAGVLAPGWITVGPLLAGDLVLLAAAIATLLRGRLTGAARWILLLPAAWGIVADVLAFAGPVVPLWWALVLGHLLLAASGALWAGIREDRPAVVALPA